MKKIMPLIYVACILSISMSLVGCNKTANTNEVIHVYNWGDYIDESVNDQFTKETGIKVVYEVYPTNEDMYAKLESGTVNYDILIPSDYMIEKMIKEDRLEKLDFTNIPNYEKVSDKFKNLSFDPNNEYSVPYMWGTVGIVYNKANITDKVDSWNILWDPKYEKQILMLDSERDSIMVALKRLGYSMNTKDEKELEEAKNELIKQKPLVLAYVGDEGKDKMINGEANFMVAWAGDAMYMIEANPDLDYVMPKEGTNFFVDSIVIPKGAKNKTGAEKYIDFLTRPDIAVKNANYIGYSTPVDEAREMLPDEVKNSPIAYPEDEDLINTEIFVDPSELVKTYSRIWTEVKAAQ
jgi:spermidine/putrescine-binding protein